MSRNADTTPKIIPVKKNKYETVNIMSELWGSTKLFLLELEKINTLYILINS